MWKGCDAWPLATRCVAGSWDLAALIQFWLSWLSFKLWMISFCLIFWQGVLLIAIGSMLWYGYWTNLDHVVSDCRLCFVCLSLMQRFGPNCDIVRNLFGTKSTYVSPESSKSWERGLNSLIQIHVYTCTRLDPLCMCLGMNCSKDTPWIPILVSICFPMLEAVPMRGQCLAAFAAYCLAAWRLSSLVFGQGRITQLSGGRVEVVSQVDVLRCYSGGK